jgi:hypothetical protein
MRRIIVQLVRELLERGLGGDELVEVVADLTGLSSFQAMQLIACEQGFDIRDAVGMPLEPLPTSKTE